MQLDGHFFGVSVVDDSAARSHLPSAAVLQVQPQPASQVVLWRSGVPVLSRPLSSLQEVVPGHARRQQALSSDPTAPRYHFCLLLKDAEPLLLATAVDSERRDVRNQ